MQRKSTSTIRIPLAVSGYSFLLKKCLFAGFTLLFLMILTGCASEPGILIITGTGSGGGGNVTNVYYNLSQNFSNNITNNITNTLANTSFACTDANSYVWNYSILNGVATGECAADSEGVDTDTWNTTLQVRDAINNSGGYNFTGIVTFNEAQIITNITALNDDTCFWGKDYLSHVCMDETEGLHIGYHPLSQFSTHTVYTGGTIQQLINGTEKGRWNESGFYLFTNLTGNVNASNILNAPWITSYTEIDGKNLTHVHDAANITSGIFSTLRLPSWNSSITLDATNITSGLFAATRIPSLNNSITSALTNLTGSTSSTACSGTDKVTQATFNAGVLTTTCGTDQTGGAGSSPEVAYQTMNTWFCDYLQTYNVASCYPYFLGAVTGTGGIAAAETAPQGTYGVYTTSRGTAANSGYLWGTSITAISLTGANESVLMLLNITQLPTQANLTIVTIGFCDAATITTVCVDGVRFNITGNTTNLRVQGQNSANSLLSNTTTSFNVTQGRYYIYNLTIINSTLSTFYIYAWPNLTLMWQSNATGNIPAGAGRETGIQFIAGETGAGTAAIRFQYDYLLARAGAWNVSRFK